MRCAVGRVGRDAPTLVASALLAVAYQLKRLFETAKEPALQRLAAGGAAGP